MLKFFHFFKKKAVSLTKDSQLAAFEKKLGYNFGDIRLLQRALTHKSYANENKLSALEQNERYEFLGDAVLELGISDLLMQYFPNVSEGELSKLRAAIVNEGSLAELARGFDLGSYLFLGRGEDQCQGRNKDSLLSDAFEAVLGSIYLDSNFESVFGVIEKHFTALLKKATRQDIIQDFKTKLQEESQLRYRSIPRYELIAESGPDHDKTFEVHLFIKNDIYGKGLGKSKKQAEQQAAKAALDKISPPSAP